MSAHDDTQNTNEMNVDDDHDTTWMDTNSRGQIVYRPRRFRGLTHREGFADYVEQAYRAATKLGLLGELAALPSLEGKTVTEIADLTRSLMSRMRNFHDGHGPNLYYGALTRMVAAAKEDVRPTASPLPALPTSPLIRQTGVAAASVSDSEIDLGTGQAAVRDVLAQRIASWSADISGHPLAMTGAFIRHVPGVGDAVEEPPMPLVTDEDEDLGRYSDEDSASVDDDGHGVTGITGTVDDDEEGASDDGDEADMEGDDGEADTEAGDEEAGVLHQNIVIELPLWTWLAILAAFTAWAALVNGVLSRDLGCRPFGR